MPRPSDPIGLGSVAHRRLLNQGIADSTFKQPNEVVAWLGAMQAQDFHGAKWSVGLRLLQATDATIEQALAKRTIVRTWPLRGTLHFVAAKDVRWMLNLLAPRVLARSAKRREQLELNSTLLARSEKLFTKALEAGRPLMRGEMMSVLERAKISTSNQRGYHLLWWAALNGVLCFGPLQGKQQTFVALDAWVPRAKSLPRDEALAEMARRYFIGHGPATLKDFGWWSGLSASDARTALDATSASLDHEVIEGKTFWSRSDLRALPNLSTRVHLLPGFDEYMLGYQDRSAALDPMHAQKILTGANGFFNPTIVIGGHVAGTWKRKLGKRAVEIVVTPFEPLTKREMNALQATKELYGQFVRRAVTVG